MKSLSLLFTFALLVGFAACSTSGNGSTGHIEVTLTDAPADYDSVTVTIEKVRVHKDIEAETDSTETDKEAEDDGWVTIMPEPIKINLLELTNGNRISLGSKELEAGHYAQIRFILGSDNTVTVNGETYALKTPSAQQSGLKLNIDAEVEKNTTYNLLVDFDATRSIVKKGNGDYSLKPVLHAVNLEATGSITGNVQPTDFKTNVLAVTDGDTVSSTLTADNGDFEIMGLMPNTYNVVFNPGNDQYADSIQTDIEVREGEATDLETVELTSN
ncbi:MAG: DUF4382 domain-containing protein [Balneolaceae bacterium]|jgi:hypothetical protein